MVLSHGKFVPSGGLNPLNSIDPELVYWDSDLYNQCSGCQQYISWETLNVKERQSKTSYRRKKERKEEKKK